jgi:GxxExxY protein
MPIAEPERQVRQERQGRQDRREPGALVDEIARVVVDAGLKIHKALGPGLLEAAYEQCLAHELRIRGVPFERQVALPLVYEGMKLDNGYRLDLVVAKSLVVEIKAVDALTRVHEAQLLTYLKLSGLPLGLLMNFNVERFKNGVKRFVG